VFEFEIARAHAALKFLDRHPERESEAEEEPP
jgi:hypothetical protein